MFSISLGYSLNGSWPDALTLDMFGRAKAAGALVVAAAGNGAPRRALHGGSEGRGQR